MTAPSATLAPPGSPYRAAVRLDEQLGDPEDGGRLLSYPRRAADDLASRFPDEACRELDALGLPAAYVPTEYGGTLGRYDELYGVIRTVARRDLTVAVAHGKTFLGAVSVWTSGTVEQGVELAGEVLRGVVVSWGLTERAHGSDLLAGEVVAVPTDAGYRVSGEKWLINNATRGRRACVLARTDPDGGARGFSVLVLDKRRMRPEHYRTLPGVALHGIRGADISGITYRDAPVRAADRVGAEGEGLEVVVRGLQLTRIVTTALSLGAGDQAMATAVDYALAREMHGRALIDLPQTRRLVAESAAELLLAEAFALVAARSIHALPEELAVVSAATKYFIPTLVEHVLGRLTTVLGTRSLLVGDRFRDGRFDKARRDHRIVGIFDGSTAVNLHALVTQFPLLARLRPDALPADGLDAAVSVDRPLPSFDRDRLRLVTRRGCSLLAGLPAAVEELEALGASGAVPPSLVEQAHELAALSRQTLAEIDRHRPRGVQTPHRDVRTAERLAACLAAAAAVQLWVADHTAPRDGATAGLWARGLWLEAALAVALPRAGAARTPRAPRHDELDALLVDSLVDHRRSGRLWSLVEHPLPGGHP